MRGLGFVDGALEIAAERDGGTGLSKRFIGARTATNDEARAERNHGDEWQLFHDFRCNLVSCCPASQRNSTGNNSRIRFHHLDGKGSGKKKTFTF